MFVVTVTFRLRPGKRGAFLPLMMENARLSASREPGCRQFDVCEVPGSPEEIFLYEVYDDAEAFAAHKATDHYLDFTAKAGPLIADKAVRTYALLG